MKENLRCPYYRCSQLQSLCSCYSNGLMCPSLQERQDYCLGEFNKCLYYQDTEQSFKNINILEV